MHVLQIHNCLKRLGACFGEALSKYTYGTWIQNLEMLLFDIKVGFGAGVKWKSAVS